MVDVIQGLAETMALGRAGLARREVLALSRSLGAAQLGSVRIAALGTSLAAIATDLTAVGVLWFAALRVEHGQLAGVQLAVVVLLTLAAFEAVSPLPAAVQASGAVSAACERVFSLERRPQRPDRRPAARAVSPAILRLELRGVRVRYEGQVRRALDGVDLCVEPGRSVAVVGPSGSGKSTLAHLLLRFVEPEQGCVLADHRDVSEVAPEDVRRSIALVPQRVHLFTGTVRDNLRLANPDWPVEAVGEALRASGFDRVVAGLPDGLDAWLGEQGWQLSGGERQRLALARAFLKPARFLVLDEPTANLDATSERALFREIAGRANRQGVLLVTHRVASVDWCDEIVVLEHGRVTERGSWAGLSSANGWFARMRAVERAHRRLDPDA
jgi:ABC-type transport system involved in cytochrome bd biosynthesis fused ATPase/permease subunit